MCLPLALQLHQQDSQGGVCDIYALHVWTDWLALFSTLGLLGSNMPRCLKRGVELPKSTSHNLRSQKIRIPANVVRTVLRPLQMVFSSLYQCKNIEQILSKHWSMTVFRWYLNFVIGVGFPVSDLFSGDSQKKSVCHINLFLNQ